MMKNALKWIGIVLLGLITVLLVGGAALYVTANNRLSNGPDVAVKTVSAAGSDADLARGEHVAIAISGCTSCHGENLGGEVFVDDPAIGVIYASNLTSGAGGAGAFYSDEDWARAIRHGIGPDGRVLGGMPSNNFAHMSDEDLSALLAYIQSAPPVDNVLPERQLSLPGTIIFGMMAYPTLPVNLIDHDNVGRASTPSGTTAEYGEYLSNIAGCRDCHGSDLGGISPEDAPPGPPPGPNLHQDGDLGSWTQDDFFTALRSGRTPDGRQLSTEMPWEHYGLMSDEELEALWIYLSSLGETAAN